jgi:large subunit ribosomal protein L14
MGTRRKLGRKKVAKARTSYGVQNGSRITIADNSGAKIAAIIMVDHYKGRIRRLPKATIGDVVTVTIKKGKSELRGNVLKCIIIRQKMMIRRVDGTRLCFEDNAGVIISKEGDPKGTEIRGPIAREAAELYPRLASISSLIV